MSENLLSRLEQSLRQSRAARMHLAARLRELEAEADSVRAELAEMDTLASQTEAAIYRLLSSVLASGNINLGLPSDAELEAAMRQSPPQSSLRAQVPVDRRPQLLLLARQFRDLRLQGSDLRVEVCNLRVERADLCHRVRSPGRYFDELRNFVAFVVINEHACHDESPFSVQRVSALRA